jgi:hypothetical protein
MTTNGGWELYKLTQTNQNLYQVWRPSTDNQGDAVKGEEDSEEESAPRGT